MSEGVSTQTGPQGTGLFSRGSGFLSEAWAELKKVSFPSRQDTMQATIVTLFIMMFVAGCLFVLDWIFNRLMAALFF